MTEKNGRKHESITWIYVCSACGNTIGVKQEQEPIGTRVIKTQISDGICKGCFEKQYPKLFKKKPGDPI
jgi:DNA-directed RNA polymerase subunit RPC12/RpoP